MFTVNDVLLFQLAHISINFVFTKYDADALCLSILIFVSTTATRVAPILTDPVDE